MILPCKAFLLSFTASSDYTCVWCSVHLIVRFCTSISSTECEACTVGVYLVTMLLFEIKAGKAVVVF